MLYTFEKIKELSKKRGLSLNQLEEKLGYSRNTLYSLKRQNVSTKRLQEIADYLEVSVDYLLGKTENPTIASNDQSGQTALNVEDMALKWSDIDFEDKKITVNKTAVRIKEKQSLQTPKTKNSKRVISIDPNTLSILKNWKKDQIKIYFKNGKHFEGDDNFIFTNQRGDWVHIHNFIPYFKRFVTDHGLKPITPHGLRHTHASLLFGAGVDPKNISDRLGHSTIKITLDLYTHITEEQRTDTVEKLLEYMVI